MRPTVETRRFERYALLAYALWRMASLAIAISILTTVLGIIALFGKRWAYVSFVVLGLLYFPVSAGFKFEPKGCQWVFDLPLALHSMRNFPHIILFAFFFAMTSAQFRYDLSRKPLVLSAAAALLMGLLIEFDEGLTGQHHCRMRDLIPDSAGILLGIGTVWVLKTIRSRWDFTFPFRRRKDGSPGNV